MSGSGNIINYNIRTSKSVERRMVLVTLAELFRNVSYDKRRYIGFGSTYFTDFRLFHRELHIDNMISFESKDSLKKRVEFNKPFKCIDVVLGKSTDKLPLIPWDEDLIDFVWMDYDEELNYDMFNDVEQIFSRIHAGSVYLMTCNKQLSKYKSIVEFEGVFGELAPTDIEYTDFSGEKDFLLIRRMLINKINETLKGRNYSLSKDQKLIFRQLFLFTYRDGAPMISFGGFLDYDNNDFLLKKYNLENYDFIKVSNERFHIEPPNITYKEAYLLNSYLPNGEEEYREEDEINFIPLPDRNRYRKLYKFLPNYMDVIG
jgi:hypothetical protein